MLCPKSNNIVHDLNCTRDDTTTSNCCGTIVRESGQDVYIPNENTAHAFEYTLDRDSAINPMVNKHDGDSGVIQIKQDNVGGHKVDFNGYTLIMGFDPSTDISTEPNTVTVLRYENVNGTTTIYGDYDI